jgi:hypothetical protein
LLRWLIILQVKVKPGSVPYGRKNRVTIFLNGQFIIVYTCKPYINHKYSLVIITPRIFSSTMLYFGWWERSWLNLYDRYDHMETRFKKWGPHLPFLESSSNVTSAPDWPMSDHRARESWWELTVTHCHAGEISSCRLTK